MKKTRFTETQMVKAIRNMKMAGMLKICRELSVSTAAFYKWRKYYGGLDGMVTIFHQQLRRISIPFFLLFANSSPPRLKSPRRHAFNTYK